MIDKELIYQATGNYPNYYIIILFYYMKNKLYYIYLPISHTWFEAQAIHKSLSPFPNIQTYQTITTTTNTTTFFFRVDTSCWEWVKRTPRRGHTVSRRRRRVHADICGSVAWSTKRSFDWWPPVRHHWAPTLVSARTARRLDPRSTPWSDGIHRLFSRGHPVAGLNDAWSRAKRWSAHLWKRPRRWTRIRTAIRSAEMFCVILKARDRWIIRVPGAPGARRGLKANLVAFIPRLVLGPSAPRERHRQYVLYTHFFFVNTLLYTSFM